MVRLWVFTLLFAVLVAASSAPASANWAIAVGRGSWGAVFNATSNYDARVLALRQCAKAATACRLVARGVNGCQALAIDPNSGSWAVAKGSTADGAGRAAYAQCRTRGVGCRIMTQYCDTTQLEF